MSLSDNTLLTGFSQGMVQRQLIARKEVNAAAEKCIDTHDVRCGGFSAIAQSLSGGNLQKFIVGRELSMTPKLFVVSQPTWGVDVGAAANIRQQLLLLAERGSGVLLVSEELDELFEITDTLCVAYRGSRGGYPPRHWPMAVPRSSPPSVCDAMVSAFLLCVRVRACAAP